MLEFSRLRAPFAGVVTQRNISEGDFVQPAGTGAKGQPLYVVRQIDPVRVFVNVPGADAMWLKDGDPVSFRLQGAGGELFTGKVTRNARSLDPQSRTLRTEIDVPNPRGKLLPGMYVQASISVRHSGVWTLPASAVVTEGDQTFCYRVAKDKAVRTPLQIGLRGGDLVEVMKMQAKAPSSDAEGPWTDFTGQEEIVSNPSGLSDGQPVRRAESK
jgi:RND family efflux transporter MFP subunit